MLGSKHLGQCFGALAAAAIAQGVHAQCGPDNLSALSITVNEATAPVTLVSAEAGEDKDTGETFVAMTFDARSARVIGDLTLRNIGQPMRIENEGREVVEAIIHSQILGGALSITVYDAAAAEALLSRLCPEAR
jgi:preprotein translocase subunit SecD